MTALAPLFLRFLPILSRWARGRLPRSARSLAETQDLVQITLLRALSHLEEFQSRGEGAFLAYLRRILLNAVTDEIRRAGRRPASETLDDQLPESSRVAEAVGEGTLASYESALAQLPAQQQEAVILRIEFGYTYEAIAEAVGSPSANAARMMISRALVRVAETMREGDAGTPRPPEGNDAP